MRVRTGARKFGLAPGAGALVLGTALTVVLVAAACGGGSASGLPTPGPGGETIVNVDMRDNSFSPSSITIEASKKYILELHNRGNVAHNLRIAGPDGEFNTADDIASDVIEPGKTASLPLEMNVAGAFPFRDDSHAVQMTGTLTVWVRPTIPPPTPSPTPTPAPTPTPEASVVPPPVETVAPEVPGVSTVPPTGP